MKKLHKNALRFILELYDKRRVIYTLARRDFQNSYMGSYLGFAWTFLQPLIFISVINIVFTLGLKEGHGVDDIPFVVYLTVGMIAWLYFSENLSSGARSIKDYSFLIKKIDFRLGILPIIKLLSSAITHIVMISCAIIVAAIHGYMPSIYLLQLIYYMAAMIFLLLGISWLTSSTSIFVKDIANMVSVVVKFGFWLTPIFWNINRIPVEYQWIIKLNPVCYIVTGYRDSIVSHIPFWEHPLESLYFWLITLIFIISGVFVFSKLRPHFAEVI